MLRCKKGPLQLGWQREGMTFLRHANGSGSPESERPAFHWYEACNSCSRLNQSGVTVGQTDLMNDRSRLLLLSLPFAISIAVILWVGRSAVERRKEPVYQGKPLSFWVTRVGHIEEYRGAPKDAVAAIRAIGPKAVPFLLEWMPHRKPQRPVFIEWCSRWFSNPQSKQSPSWDCVEIA
ncbi:MAG: hypothetical protein JWR69_2192 [Pedosphaera sp.]|nr:hypothetical protein [Pedosphaera sp.]